MVALGMVCNPMEVYSTLLESESKISSSDLFFMGLVMF